MHVPAFPQASHQVGALPEQLRVRGRHAMKQGGSANAVLACACGQIVTVPLLLGSGNDMAVELPDGWYLSFVEFDKPIVECPGHQSTNR